MACYVRFMSRASSHALKRPPVTAPSEPAGATPFPELAVAIENKRRRGRGAQSNTSGRFEAEARVAFDDGWQSLDELPPFKTTVSLDTSRKVITRNESPDIGFDRSINPYRGCEHGCVYCFARPTHAFLGLSPGLDFESKLLAKPDAPELLEKELAAPGYEPRMIAIGTNTDPYQPIEREYKIMRGILEVLDRAGHPCAERFRDRAHSRCRSPCRRQGSKLRAAAAAAGSARPVSRMADGKLSRPLPSRLHPDPRHARR